MTDNVLPMPPRPALSGVQFAASFVVRDDGAVALYIPLEPYAQSRRMLVCPSSLVLIEDGAPHHVPLTQIHAALLWLANRGPRP